MRGQLTGTIFLLALLLCPALRAADGPFIQALQIRGSGRPVEIETHAGQTLDRARIARDVRRLWATGWFEDIRVETSETPEGIQVVFTLVEKPRLYLRRVRCACAARRNSNADKTNSATKNPFTFKISDTELPGYWCIPAISAITATNI